MSKQNQIAVGIGPLANTGELDFYDAEALLDRLSTGLQSQARQVVFVVGSGLTNPATPGGPGVPGVQGVIDLIRAEFTGIQLQQLEDTLSTSSNAYQDAFKFLLGRRGPHTANGIIKKAVAKARRISVDGDGVTKYEISASTDDEICRLFDNDSSGWLLTPAVDGLGRIVSAENSPFNRMVVTTNFDPLIGAAIARHGGHSFRTFLHRDGSLGQADGSGTHIVHLHGYWYGSDTLHTPRQLVQPRPQLKASLSHLLRGNIFVVMAYSGWDDVFTRTLMDVVLEDSSFPEILWCFYNKNPEPRQDLLNILGPGIDRGSVMLYSGIDVHDFLPRLGERWGLVKDVSVTTADQPAASEDVTISSDKASGTISGSTLSLLLRDIDQDRPPLIEFLVGRDQDLEALATSAFRVGFITGFGGQGKSALAAAYFKSVEAASAFPLRIWRDCREQSARFEDQIVAIVKALSNGSVSGAELAQQPISDLADLFVKLTEDAPMLLVFDNMDHYVDIERRTLTGDAGRFVERFLHSDSLSRLVLTCRPTIKQSDEATFSRHLEGLTLPATERLFALRKTMADLASVERAHAATKGHSFWLDLLAAQVARRAPEVKLDDLLSSISDGTGELPDATLRSIWRSLRPREQVTLQALAEVLRPTTHLELADYVRNSLHYKNFNKAVKLLRDLNLIVVKTKDNEAETYELHPLIRAFIQKTIPRIERTPFILAILQSYAAWLGSHKIQLSKRPGPGIVHRWIEAAELCLNADKNEEALGHLSEIGRAVRLSEPPNEFVRVSQRLFDSSDLSKLKLSRSFDRVYNAYLRLLVHLGRTESAAEALHMFSSTLDGKDTRYILYCDMQCYMHWVNGEYSVAIRWGMEGEELRSSGVDTKYSAAHNLALAQRDAGAIEPALKYFLQGVPLADVVDPNKIDRDLGGALYGNVGRCLQLMGQIDSAISCFKKSAKLIEDEKDDLDFENQAFIRQWIGDLLFVRGDTKTSRLFMEAAVGKWSIISPPRAEKLVEAIRTRFGEGEINPHDAELQVLIWIMKVDLPN
ncbi:MAG: SIR2 family protein [Janthinobacterium lividum]